MTQQTPDAVKDVLRREYDAHERRADALDTRAGLVLGFAGLLVSVTPPELTAVLVVLVRALAAAAAMLALAAFAAALPAWQERPLASGRAPLPVTLVDTLWTNTEASARVQTKSRRIHASLRLLGAALATIVVGTVSTAVLGRVG